MRSNLRKNAVAVPSSLANARIEQNRIARTKDFSSITDSIYKGNLITINDPDDPYHQDVEFEVRYALRILYFNKCAYCESTSYKPDVEHYRPKKGVTGAQRNSHGYYWLCYEWSNLIPACYECNSRSGKWNKFPINGTRRVLPSFLPNQNLNFDACHILHAALTNEQPLILNPESETVEQFFSLEWNGKINGTDGIDGKGDKTIKTCDLNRGNLIIARWNLMKDFVEKIDIVLTSFRNNLIEPDDLRQSLQISLMSILEKSKFNHPYSFVALFISNNFSQYVDHFFVNSNQLERDILKDAFQEIIV